MGLSLGVFVLGTFNSLITRLLFCFECLRALDLIRFTTEWARRGRPFGIRTLGERVDVRPG